MDLEKIRETGVKLVNLAREVEAEKSVLLVTLPDGLRYHFALERVYKSNGKRGAAKVMTLVRETLTVKENSQQGATLYAAPAEWVLEGK